MVPKESFLTYNPGVCYTIGTKEDFLLEPTKKEEATKGYWVERVPLDDINDLFIKMAV